MPDLPLNEKVMPMNDDLIPEPSGPPDEMEDDTDPVDGMLREALRGGHFLLLPPNIPPPPGLVCIVPLPEDMDADEIFGGTLPPGVEEIDLEG